MTFIQSLKGAPASVLLALAFTGRPMSNRELRDWTGYSDKSIAHATRRLVECRWITAYSRFGPWSVAPGRLVASVTTLGIPGVFAGTSGIFDDSGGISVPSSSSGLTESNTQGQPLLEAAPAEFPVAQAAFDKNVQALLEAGIREPAAGVLASLPHVTPEYIRDHVAQVLEEGKELGAAIYRMRRGWFARSRKKKNWDPETVNAKIRRFVEGGD